MKGKYLVSILLIVFIGVIIAGNIKEEREMAKYENLISTSMQTNQIDQNEEYSESKMYVSAFKNSIQIYMKGSNPNSEMYLGYNLSLQSKELNKNEAHSNYKVWNIDAVNEYERQSKDRFLKVGEIITGGAWDLAIREKRASDFVGGVAHGDEVLTDYEIMVDGEVIDFTHVTKVEADQVVLELTSDIYRDNTITETAEIIAKRSMLVTFNVDGVTTEQTIEFNSSIHLNKSYLAMLPALRKIDGSTGDQITDTVKINNSEFDVSEKDFNIPQINFKPSEYVELYGKNSGYFISVEVAEKSPDLNSLFMLSNAERYNKIYFAFNEDNLQVDPGDVWKQTTIYKIDTKN